MNEKPGCFELPNGTFGLNYATADQDSVISAQVRTKRLHKGIERTTLQCSTGVPDERKMIQKKSSTGTTNQSM
jgi:hypothetical protein